MLPSGASLDAPPRDCREPKGKGAALGPSATKDGFEFAWKGENSPSAASLLDQVTYWCTVELFFMVHKEENGWTELRATFERLFSEATAAGKATMFVGGVLVSDAISLAQYDPSKEIRRNIHQRVPPEIYMSEPTGFAQRRFYLRRINVSINCSGAGPSAQTKIVVREEEIKEGKDNYAAASSSSKLPWGGTTAPVTWPKWWATFNVPFVNCLARIVPTGKKAVVTEVVGSSTKKFSGIVRFMGMIEGKPGFWRNDGSVAGKKYFSCPPKHGIFVLPEEVENE